MWPSSHIIWRNVNPCCTTQECSECDCWLTGAILLRCNDPSLHWNIYHLHFPLLLLWYAHPAAEACANEPAMISLSLGSRLTVHGRNISTSLAVRTGILEERKTSKLRMSPSISSSGSTSFVIGIFLEILKKKQKQKCDNTELLYCDFINYRLKAVAYMYQHVSLL